MVCSSPRRPKARRRRREYPGLHPLTGRGWGAWSMSGTGIDQQPPQPGPRTPIPTCRIPRWRSPRKSHQAFPECTFKNGVKNQKQTCRLTPSIRVLLDTGAVCIHPTIPHLTNDTTRRNALTILRQQLKASLIQQSSTIMGNALVVHRCLLTLKGQQTEAFVIRDRSTIASWLRWIDLVVPWLD